MQRATRSFLILLLLFATGCELVASFDREKIGLKPGDSGIPKPPGDTGAPLLDGEITDAEPGDSPIKDSQVGIADVASDAAQGCADDSACLENQFCDDAHACAERLANNGTNRCSRNRQCSTDGGCCQNVCVSLRIEAHCGKSADGDAATCAIACQDTQYCDSVTRICLDRFDNDGEHECARDRQCKVGGGCCRLSSGVSKCISLTADSHCGASTGDDQATCGTDCTVLNGTGSCIASSNPPGCGCGDDSECTTDQYCDSSSGSCRPRLANNEACKRDRECTSGGCCNLICISLTQDGHCGANGCGIDCGSSTNRACLSDTRICGCIDDSNCATAEYCGTDRVCAARKINDGASTCSRDRQCQAGGGCCGAVCVSLSQAGHCGSSGGDTATTCGDNCSINSAGHACLVSACGCNTDTDCPTDRYCNGSSHQCVLQLDIGADCAGNRQCASNSCCSTTSKCVDLTQPATCGASGCGTDCTSSADGHACVSSACGCTTDGDCAADRYCGASSKCVARLGVGGSCDRERMCASGGCCSTICVDLTLPATCGTSACGTNCSAQVTNKACIATPIPHCGCNNPATDCDTSETCTSNSCGT